MTASKPLADHAQRIVDLDRYGHRQRYIIRPHRYRVSRLAAQLGDHFQDVARDIPGSVNELSVAIRSFLRHMDGQLMSIESPTSFDLRSLRLRHIDAWEISKLQQQRAHPTDTAYRHVTQLFSLLRRIDQDDPGLLHPDISLRLTRETRLSHIRRPADAEHTPDEIRRIRSAAHRVVRARTIDDSATVFNADRHLLFAFHILLSLSTGEPPESIRGIHMSDITATPVIGHRVRNLQAPRGHSERLSQLVQEDAVQMFAVTLTKRRSGMTYDVVYDRHEHKQAFRALAGLISYTSRFRHHQTDSLWIRPGPNGAIIHNWADQWLNLEGWYESHVQGRPIEGPWKFARLRKTAIARQAASDPARYLRDGRNHTTRTFFGHYTNSAVLRAQSGRLVVDTIEAFFDAAVSGPTVITPEAADLLSQGGTVDRQINRATADSLLNGELEGALTACRDPEDSPFAAAGHICPVARSGRCFTCPNAIITQEHLPQLIAYERISDPDTAADPVVWRQVWRDTRQAIQSILPLFPQHLVDAARTQVDSVLNDFGVENGPRGLHD